MHYRNGREAKPGDKVLDLPTGASGILHSLNANAQTCNGVMTPPSPYDRYVTLSQCVHVDDIADAIPPAAKPV